MDMRVGDYLLDVFRNPTEVGLPTGGELGHGFRAIPHQRSILDTERRLKVGEQKPNRSLLIVIRDGH